MRTVDEELNDLKITDYSRALACAKRAQQNKGLNFACNFYSNASSNIPP